MVSEDATAVIVAIVASIFTLTISFAVFLGRITGELRQVKYNLEQIALHLGVANRQRQQIYENRR